MALIGGFVERRRARRISAARLAKDKTEFAVLRRRVGEIGIRMTLCAEDTSTLYAFAPNYE
jgi:hypothetical protein